MKIALIQLSAAHHKKKNLDKALRLTLRAVLNKAQFILLPEVFNYRGPAHQKTGYHEIAETIPGESTVPFMVYARAHKVFILVGSLYEKIKGTKKIYNTSVLITDQGRVAAKYRKIHLFDARLGKKSIQESEYLLAGESTKTVTIKDFKVGLSVCYDLRFPELYGRYKKEGVNIITVPSSFTKPTGQAHFETLLRARAIENLAFVLAPNQFGKTKNGVVTYGNSMVVDPWGKIIARASGHREEIIYASLDKKTLAQARKNLPGIAKKI